MACVCRGHGGQQVNFFIFGITKSCIIIEFLILGLLSYINVESGGSYTSPSLDEIISSLYFSSWERLFGSRVQMLPLF
jgi:hypothetical protein